MPRSGAGKYDHPGRQPSVWRSRIETPLTWAHLMCVPLYNHPSTHLFDWAQSRDGWQRMLGFLSIPVSMRWSHSDAVSWMESCFVVSFLGGFGQLLVDLTSYTFPPHWLNVFPSVKVVFFLLEYCNIMALFHQELNQELKDPFRFVSTGKLRIQKITFLLKMQFF